jgi:hypothetical protein
LIYRSLFRYYKHYRPVVSGAYSLLQTVWYAYLFPRPKRKYKDIIRRSIIRGTHKGKATNPRARAKKYYRKQESNTSVFLSRVLRTNTWPGDLRLNSYRYSRTPGRTSLYVSYWSCRRATSGWKCTNQYHVMDPWGSRRGSKGDLFARRFYISLGCYLLDKSFVLNSNNILIYWYSFTSNELYFQV